MKSKVLLILAVLVCSQTSSAFWEIFANTKYRNQRVARASYNQPSRKYSTANQYRMYGRGSHITNRLSCQNPQGDYNCSVCNCFHEAGNQSWQGQIDVGRVVMTRTRTKGYPPTVCGVIKQYKQFSWWDAPGAMDRSPVPGGHRCFAAAKESLNFKGRFATHYHATYVNPKWNRNKVVVARVGAHIFYNSRSLKPRSNPNIWGGSTVATIGFDNDGVLHL